MKKIFKVAPLFLALPLLASCGVSKPSFKKAGAEISKDDFVKALDEESKSIDLLSEEKVGSATLSKTTKKETKTTEKRGKKSVSKKTESSTDKDNYTYDADNLVVKVVSSKKSSISKKTKEEKYSKTEKTKTEGYVQKHTRADEKYLISVNKTTKVYQPVLPCSSDEFAVEMIKLSVVSTLGSSFSAGSSLLSQYNSADEEGKKDFKFYKNVKVYTIELSSSKDNELSYGKQTVKKYEKYQVVFADGKFDVKSYKESTTTTEYGKDYVTPGDAVEHVKGDVTEVVSKTSTKYSAKQKKTKVKAVNLKGYAEYGFEAK